MVSTDENMALKVVTDKCLGIAWLAVEGNPIIFEVIGLGMGV